MKRPLPALILMFAAGAISLSAITGLVRDPGAFLFPRPLWLWMVDVLGFVVAPITFGSLWKKSSSARWWGLSFIMYVAALFLWTRLQRSDGPFSNGQTMEVALPLALLAAFSYGFGFTEKAKSFFSSAQRMRSESSVETDTHRGPEQPS